MAVLIFIVILGVLVLIHELGHFFVARIFGVGVEEFGFGFPPRIFGVKKKTWKTLLSFNLIPVGGFVKIKGAAGDDPEEKGFQDNDSFFVQKAWKKFAILFAGIGMNLVLGAILLSIGFSIGMPTAIEGLPESASVRDEKIQIFSVQEDSPADRLGIKTADTLVSIDGQTFSTTTDVGAYTSERPAEEVTVEWQRGSRIFTEDVQLSTLDGKGSLGVSLDKTGIVSYPMYKAVWMGIKSTIFIVFQIFYALWDIVRTLIVSQQVSGDVAGPVGIAVLTGQFVELGSIHLLQFAAILSINLGIFNFLPIPALDGGRIIFILIEKIRRKPVSQKLEAIIHNTGFLFLLLIVLLVTVRDVSKFSFFQNLF